MERGNRIELSALAWKAKVLPLYEPRIVISIYYSSSGGLAKGEVEGFFLDHIEYDSPSTLPL